MIVVGIGASAGGIEALRKLLSNLPPDTGAAFAIVQHLSPDFKSVMAELLQKYSKMPIRQIEKDTLVEANHVYLMPNNKTMTYFHGILKLHDRPKDNKLNLPIDDFFHSLGSELKHEAIGIILSGSGTDGSRGARTIKEQEGIVLVQSPQSAAFDGMPRALIELDIADGIFPPEELATRIDDVIKVERKLKSNKKGLNNGRENGSEDAPEIANFHDEWLEKIIHLAAYQSNIPFSDYKIATLQRRSEKQMALNKYSNLKDYYHFLKENESQVEILYRDFLISVTRFFRDQEFFEEVKNTLIPQLFNNLEEGQVCRIWVVACSSGEEAYSIGMLVMEYLRKNHLNHDFKIFASDVNKKSVQIATEGVYNSSISSDVPLPLLETYFTQEGKFYRIKPHLREKIIFAIHDVISDPPFINMNLISCRNFLIYLKNETKVKILKTFYFALRKQQHLILGPSESLGEFSNVFIHLDRKFNIYQKEEMDYMSNRQSFKPTTELWKNKPIYTKKYFDKEQPEIPEFEEKIDDPFSPFLIERYVPRIVFLTKDLDVLYMKGNFGAIFSIPQNVVKMNLEKMLPQENVLFFRDAVRVALDMEEAIVYDQVGFKKKGNITYAKVSFEKINLEDLNTPLIKAEITFLKEGQVSEKEVKTFNLADNGYHEERILRLEKELTEKREEVKDIKSQLETINEELNTSNQELMASNEELQSTNEELQSVNEELHTVNAELHHKNKTLYNTNNDISNLLKTINIGTIFLDKALCIRRFTKAINREFDLKNTDIGRPITSFNNRLTNINLEKLCKQVIKTGDPVEQEVKDKDGLRFLLRIYPFVIEEKGNQLIDGVVISLVDINEISQLKSSLEKMGHQFNTLLGVTDVSVVFFDFKGNITFANKSLDGYTPEELIEKNIYDLFPGDAMKEMKKYVEQATEHHREQVFNIMVGNNKKAVEFHFRLMPVSDYDEQQKIAAYFLAAVELDVINSLYSHSK